MAEINTKPQEVPKPKKQPLFSTGSVMKVAQDVKTESLNFVVAGFSFASAIAWMDLVRWAIANLVKVKQNGGSYFLLTALMTTLLSVVVFMVVSRYNSDVKRTKPVFAVGR